MYLKLSSAAIVLALFAGPAGAQPPSADIIEESDTYRVYADGSNEQKVVDPAELEAIQAARFEIRARKQDSEITSATIAATGALEENAVPGLWKGFGGVPYGCNGRIEVIKKGPDGKIYLGGVFSACNDVIVNNITAWDPATNTFEALGSPAGVKIEVTDLAFMPNGDLIVVGGIFSSLAFSSSESRIARWNGVSWTRVSQDSFVPPIMSVEIDPATGDIYVGGFFDEIFLNDGGSVQVNRIAVWDGFEWSALGDGMGGGSVRALRFNEATLFAGGFFTQAGGQPASGIASWDGSEWSPLGSGVEVNSAGASPAVFNIETDGNRVVAGGQFDTAGGVETGAVALWDGTLWSSINGPEFGTFRDMDYSGGRLVVTGGFNAVDEILAPKVAIWNGANWSATVDESEFSGSGNSIISDGDDIYVSGGFSVIGALASDFPASGTFANRIARFDGATQQWGPLGDGRGNNTNDTVSDIIEVDGEVWIVGRFDAAGTQLVPSGIARWNGSEWLPVPGDTVPCGRFGDLALGTANDIFATTSCSSDGIQWFGSARFDGIDWQPLGNGPFPSNVIVDPTTGDAYYSGSFTETRGDSPITVNRIARWDGIAWNPVGTGAENGVSSSTSSIASIGSAVARNGSVMVGGSFDRAGTAEVDGLALWNGSVWGVPGDGLKNGDSSPGINQLEGQGSNVFAAGSFNRSGTEELRNIAKWNGTSWIPLQGAVGEGVELAPRALHATPDKLYVGGSFSEAGGRPTERIARWDGADWRSLGAGSENGLGRSNPFLSPIDVMQSTADGIFVGGSFGGSNAVASPNLIRFVPMENLALDLGADVTGIAGNQVNYEITIVNNGEFALVDSSLLGNWSPQPTSVSWTCTPVAPATRGCTQDSGSGSLNQILEVPAGATVRFEVTVDADVAASPFLDFTATWSAAPVEGATGTTEDSVLLQSTISTEGVFKDDFE